MTLPAENQQTVEAARRIRLERPDQGTGAKTRTTRPHAHQHYLWENVVTISYARRFDSFVCNLTPAAAEDLGNELLRIAALARLDGAR